MLFDIKHRRSDQTNIPTANSSGALISIHLSQSNILAIARRNTEATHVPAQSVVIPVIRCNSNLVAARLVAVDTKNTIGPQVVLPVNSVTAFAGGLSAALVVFAVPLPAAGGEDPGVGHRKDGGDGGDGGGGELHFVSKLMVGFEWLKYLSRELKIDVD